jgi:hypothetical protein
MSYSNLRSELKLTAVTKKANYLQHFGENAYKLNRQNGKSPQSPFDVFQYSTLIKLREGNAVPEFNFQSFSGRIFTCNP